MFAMFGLVLMAVAFGLVVLALWLRAKDKAH